MMDVESKQHDASEAKLQTVPAIFRMSARAAPAENKPLPVRVRIFAFQAPGSSLAEQLIFTPFNCR